MKKKPLYIYGAGGLGREIATMVRAMSEWEPVGFFDDRVPAGRKVGGLPVVGGKDTVLSVADVPQIAIAIGDPTAKAAVVQELSDAGCAFPSLVHPSAVLQDRATIHLRAGAIITAGCVLTTYIEIGEHVLVNLKCTIGHDVVIDACCSIMPGVNIAGEVRVGREVLIGSGASIRNQVNIGDRSRVGMGSVVLRDVSSGQTVVGVPAKPLVR